MRNSGRYRAMSIVFDRCETMAKLCKDTNDYLVHEGVDLVIRDSLKEVINRLLQISHMASDAARDEYDFGANGVYLPYTIEHAVEKVLQKHGLTNDGKPTPPEEKHE